MSKVTKKEVRRAQREWSDAIVRIGQAYTHGENYVTVARDLIIDLYDFDDDNTILFKPTLTSERQFRTTLEAALSYFVADNKKFPEDKGFALRPWIDVEFANVDIVCGRKHAIAMGNYYFTEGDGAKTKVEYTFGYVAVDGGLKINVHHSSKPYEPTE